MLGFLPGFGYMGTVDATIAAPRRGTPRVRVPAGSVGIAGRQTGIYPRESPGGWQLIGRTAVKSSTPVAHSRPCLHQATACGSCRVSSSEAMPGQRCADARVRHASETACERLPSFGRDSSRRFRIAAAGDIRRAACPSVVRWISSRIAWRTLLVGNGDDAATLEVTLAGPELRIEQETRVAIAGADLQRQHRWSVQRRSASRHAVVAGSVLRFGERRSGTRAYVAFDGGIDVPMRAWQPRDARRCSARRARWPGAAAGDRLAVGTRKRRAVRRGRSTPPAIAERRCASAGAAGPQDDFFAEPAFTSSNVRGSSSRRSRIAWDTGCLERAFHASSDREMISDATFAGGIQVPPSGEPILLMAIDRRPAAIRRSRR